MPQLYPDDALATLTADDMQLVQSQIGTVASVVHGVSDKNDPSCNGAQCGIPTQGFTCDQAVVNAHKAKWCMVRRRLSKHIAPLLHSLS